MMRRMEGVLSVTKGSDVYALFVDASLPVEGHHFVTDNAAEFQVGLFQRPAGHAVKPHMHPRRAQTIQGVTEFVYIKEGKVRVKVFDEEWNELAVYEAGAGHFFVFFRGGHAIDMLEPTRFIEVKQGPYPGDKVAKVFQ
ncbi:MAG: hypothetical protein Greene041619_59 [Candidatus Peregrinibacteria bacterium Greene0416_19]|nr:MAG: hypothetical protein Greene041619_59 [Candidatus Peregrinibacteria bacterium Greene0416_19]